MDVWGDFGVFPPTTFSALIKHSENQRWSLVGDSSCQSVNKTVILL